MTTEEHYVQGGLDYQFVGKTYDQRLECSICLLCLRNPHQTSCGHRFCYSCILTWLNEGKSCPHDNASLGEGDLFPDVSIAREISQLQVKCPMGCEAVMTVGQVENHVCPAAGVGSSSPPNSIRNCPHCGQSIALKFEEGEQKSHQLICPHIPVACLYAQAGCTLRPSRQDLSSHLKNDVAHHLQLLNEKVAKLQLQLTDVSFPAVSSSSGSSVLQTTTSQEFVTADSSSSTQGLLHSLYQRIVSLEQKNGYERIGQEETKERLGTIEERLTFMPDGLARRFCHGRYVWRISQLTSKLRQSSSSSGHLYSPAFYTAPTLGYKACLRCHFHLSEGGEQHLGLFLHLMPGEDDDMLDWPFSGQITMKLKSRLGSHLDLVEVMNTPSPNGLSAFEKPQTPRNPMGFGHQEFIKVRDLCSARFWDPVDDTIAIVVNVQENINRV